MADAQDSTIVLSFKYRVLPTKRQHKALAEICEAQRILYNASLEHRIGAYRKAGKTITLYTQQKELTELRQEPEFSAIPANLQRWTLKRLDDAYRAFFRRVKAKGERVGFPRFRGKGRWSSFGFAEFSGIQSDGKRLRFKGMPGGLRVHLHRPLPDSKPLGCTFTRDAKGWYVCLQYRIPTQALPKTGQEVGIDVGLSHLATLSTGEHIPNPRIARKAEKNMRRRQRALSRCKKGSKRRTKLKLVVNRAHTKIANTRNTYLHQVSARLVKDYDLIVIEDLNLKGLAGGILAKSFHDVALGRLRQFLTYKAAGAGKILRAVNPRKTSQECPECGAIAVKALKQRVHRCPCGSVKDRDHASSQVILSRGVLAPEPRKTRQWPISAAGNIALQGIAI